MQTNALYWFSEWYLSTSALHILEHLWREFVKWNLSLNAPRQSSFITKLENSIGGALEKYLGEAVGGWILVCKLRLSVLGILEFF